MTFGYKYKFDNKEMSEEEKSLRFQKLHLERLENFFELIKEQDQEIERLNQQLEKKKKREELKRKLEKQKEKEELETAIKAKEEIEKIIERHKAKDELDEIVEQISEEDHGLEY